MRVALSNSGVMVMAFLRCPLLCAPVYDRLVGMEPDIVFVSSAFKHGVTREDIIHAYRTQISAGLMDSCGNKYAFIGFNRAGNLIEVFYNPIEEDAIKVFHAMGCRDGVRAQLEQ